MLLERIKLVNFRQFRNETIEFAKGEHGKNVTIILGENGTGKTTFAQAFFWCMYGETEFTDKIILNRMVAMSMTPNRPETVRVELTLIHGEVEYTLIREQTYRKEYSGKVKGDNTVFNIARKDRTGNTEYIKSSLCESEVKSILPKELSRYFFFDGERIERMSKDISQDKKAVDFADAVKGLLGLNAIYSAIQHFKPSSKYGVIGSYESSYDVHSNTKIQEYTQEVQWCKERIGKINVRLEELEEQTEAAKGRKSEKIEEIKIYAEGEKLQKEREDLQRRIANAKQTRAMTVKGLCGDFGQGMNAFFSARLIRQALQMLSDKDFTGKDIPHMHADTIEYLLAQKICICGTHLDEGTIPYQKVKSLIEFLPPQSLSTSIGDFKKEAKSRANQLGYNMFDEIRERLAVIGQQDDDIQELLNDLHSVEGRLSGGDVRSKVKTINQEIKTCDEIIKRNDDEHDKLIGERGRLEEKLSRAENDRLRLTLLDDKNKQIEIYKAYAQRIFEELLYTYNTSETKIRQRLQDTINEIFKQIYEGGLSLTIDDKYHISVYATDYEGDVETSTAQSISVIFAFITAIIKMARENRNATDENAKLLSSEPYPLVMDAPLSAFDKRRIRTVCTALPETAEQVVIFIKDTDGELAEEYMGNRIGSRHRFEKKNEFETVLD